MNNRMGVLVILLLSGALLFATKPAFFHPALQVGISGDTLRISVERPAQGNELYLYYRTPGMEEFQFRKMKEDAGGVFSMRLAKERLCGDRVEYYFAEKRNGIIKKTSPLYTHERINEGFPQVQQETQAVMLPAPREPWIRASGMLSSSRDAYRHGEIVPGQSYVANGNFRLFRSPGGQKLQFEFDTNLAYLNPRTTLEKPFNLTNMVVRVRRAHHKLELGDISFNHSEFTVTGVVRRGLNYEWNGKNLYFNAFFTSSQQKRGFEGIGIPGTDASILGTVAGVNFGSWLRVRGLLLTGKDNQQGMTFFTTANPFRAGTLISLFGDCNLLQNRLLLSGEWGKSDFGSSANKDGISKLTDYAWRGALALSTGPLMLNADYRKIGSNFNSIANPLLQNDREGFNGNLMLSLKRFSLSLLYVDQKNYLNNPIMTMQRQRREGASIVWKIGRKLRLGGDFILNNLDYDASTGLQTGGTAMDTIEYAATLGCYIGMSGLNLRVGKAESRTFTASILGAASLNLYFGQVLTFSPSFGYQSTDNLTDHSNSKIYNLFLNSEIFFLPQVFTLSTMGSWMKNQNSFSPSTMLSLGVNLNFYLSKLFKQKARPMVSLKSKFQQNELSGVTTSSFTFALQGDLAF